MSSASGEHRLHFIISHQTCLSPLRPNAAMSDDRPPQSPTSRRRSSFAGQTFADLFGTGRSSVSRTSTESTSPPQATQQLAGPISQAAVQAQRRRMSITSLGLSGSPNSSTSPFNSMRGGRRDSIGSANSGSVDESAIAEDDAAPARDPNNTPFTRRTSFGARALRDIRTTSSGGGGGGGPPGSPGQNGTRSPTTASRKAATAQNGTISSRDTKGRGLSLAPDSVSHRRRTVSSSFSRLTLTPRSPSGSSGGGFNWSDNLRTRAERSSVANQGVNPFGGVGQAGSTGNHSRAKSVAVMEPPPAAEMPKPKEQKRPDHFQERILKGDFYMD